MEDADLDRRDPEDANEQKQQACEKLNLDVPNTGWTVPQMKEYLRKLEGRVSGRKGDLLQR